MRDTDREARLEGSIEKLQETASHGPTHMMYDLERKDAEALLSEIDRLREIEAAAIEAELAMNRVGLDIRTQSAFTEYLEDAIVNLREALGISARLKAKLEGEDDE